MKKTTLYKLVKQAFKEVFFEEKKKGKNTFKISDKAFKTLNEKFTPEEYSEIINYTSKKNKFLLSEQVSRSQIKKIYEFLIENAEEKVSFERIAKDPIIQNLNSDGLQILYGNILELSFEEFEEIIAELFIMSCPSTKPYGTLAIYESGNCTPQIIDDGFICCSDNNPNSNQAEQHPLVTLFPVNIGLDLDGNQGCHCPSGDLSDCLGNGSTQFTFADFETYAMGFGGVVANVGVTGLCSDPSTMCITDANTSGCGGCAHNLSLNYGNPSSVPAGCPDPTGVFSPSDLSCCEFEGCGAINTIPAADVPKFGTTATPSGQLAATNGTGVIAIANETAPYWTDNGSCTFTVDCANSSITIGTTSHLTTNYNGTTDVIGGPPTLPNYDYQGISNNPSLYHNNSNFTTTANPSLCNITECADPNLNPLGTNATLLASQDSSNFVALAGTYGTGPNQYTVTAGGTCDLTGCTDQTAANWANPALFPGVTITSCTSCCVSNITGCGTATTTATGTGIHWTNYNAGGTVTINDNNCSFTGCTDYSTGGVSTAYVCTLYPYMCDMTANGGAGAPDTTLTEMSNGGSFSHDQTACVGISGCMDNGSNQDQTWWDGTNDASFDYAAATGEPTYGNAGVPTNYDQNATQESGGCIYTTPGCTLTGATNLNTNTSNLVYIEDQSCTFVGCTDSTANNYWCISNPSLCTSNQPDLTLIASLTNNNSCTFTTVNGCTDNISTGGGTFLTYTNTANASNSYTAPSGTAGVGACNYNAAATNDDGSCTYPDNLCDCNGNSPLGDCDCDGNVNLGCGCGNPQADCNGDCNGTAAVDECNICSGGLTGLIPNAFNTTQIPGPNQDCFGVCNGTSVEDDCGVCDGNNDCHGCMIPETTAGNYSAAHTSDPLNECVFNYCTTPLNSYNIPSNNYICISVPNLCYASGGSSGQSYYGDNTSPCTAADNTCTPDSSLGTWNTSTGCTYPVVGCMDPGGTQTWGVIGPFIQTPATATGNNTGAATNYNAAATIECDGTNSTEGPAVGPDGITQTYDTGNTSDNSFGACCKYTPGCTHPGYVGYNISNVQDDGNTAATSTYCGVAILDGCMNPIMQNYNPNATQNTSTTCVYSGCVDDGTNNDVTPPNDSLWNDYVCMDNTGVANPSFAVVLDNNTTIPAGQSEPVWKWAGCPGQSVSANFNLNYGQFTDENLSGTVVFNAGVGVGSSVNLYDPLANITGTAEVGSCNDLAGGTVGCTQEFYTTNDGSGNIVTTQPVVNYNPLHLTDGDCDFVACDNPLASNYFCVDNPQFCDMTLGPTSPTTGTPAGLIDPLIGTLNANSTPDGITIPACANIAYPTYDCDPDGGPNPTGGASITPIIGCVENPNGTGEFTGAGAFQDCMSVCKECSQVTAKRCNGTGTAIFNCDGIGGSDGLEIDGFGGDFTGAPGQIWINTITAPYFVGQRFRIKEKIQPMERINEQSALIPAPAPQMNWIWVSYEVETLVQKFSKKPARQAEGTQCFPTTWACRCLTQPCQPGDIGLGGNVITEVGGHRHYCIPKYDGTGYLQDLDECLENCPCEASGRSKSGFSQVSPKKVDGCPGHTGKGELPKSCMSSKYHFDKKRDVKDPVEPTKPTIDKPIDIDTVEPVDIDRPTEPTGSVDVPERPTITPDTPELKESRRLRKLIKKWKKNNL